MALIDVLTFNFLSGYSRDKQATRSIRFWMGSGRGERMYPCCRLPSRA